MFVLCSEYGENFHGKCLYYVLKMVKMFMENVLCSENGENFHEKCLYYVLKMVKIFMENVCAMF